ncbi:MAG: hypothetical protein QG662_1059 [Pseudomonadota bacterium]|nr:hypothetical protein [Pseudomonadota bacterium]
MNYRLNRIAPLSLAAFLALSCCAAIAAPGSPAAAAEVARTGSRPDFARVGDAVITAQEFDNALYNAARSKFYHGKPPEGELARVQREVGDQLVERALLLREAGKRGLKPEAAEVQKTLQEYEQRYAGSEQWKASRDRVLPGLTRRLEEDSLLKLIERLVRDVPAPDDGEVRAYYAAHPEKFTEPEQLRVSVILLRVDPGASQAVFDGAFEEAKGIVERLRGGADFAALARIHSSEASAEKGGDLGYLHRGMLPEGTQEAMDKAKPGEISDPLRVLEGIAVLRLEDRKTAKLNNYEKVRERARDLLQRDQSDQAMKTLLARLKKETPIQVDESFYLPLPTEKKPDHATPKPVAEPGTGSGAQK